MSKKTRARCRAPSSEAFENKEHWELTRCNVGVAVTGKKSREYVPFYGVLRSVGTLLRMPSMPWPDSSCTNQATDAPEL